MMTAATVLALFCVAGVALWGWGWATERGLRVAPQRWPVSIAIGLAAVVFAGGVLNALGGAKPVALDAIVVAGVVLAATGLYINRHCWRDVRLTRGALVAAGPLLVTAGFVAVYLAPQQAYNIHDDLEKYFAHPVRMLVEGTFTANPLGSLGAETLGAQAWLHGFVATRFSLEYLGLVDSGFCLVLCVALAGFGVKPRGWGVAAGCAGCAVLLINPQIVNVSAVFSAASLTLAAVLLLEDRPSRGSARPNAAVLGLFYAALLALKSTYVAFVVAHVAALAIASVVFRNQSWKSALGACGWTAFFLSPWIAVHLPLYLAPARPALAVPPAETESLLLLFSTARNFWQAVPLHSTLLALAAAGVGVAMLIAVVRARVHRSPANAALFVAAATAAGVYFGMMLIGAPVAFGQAGSLRYTAPVLIAMSAALLRLPERAEWAASRIWTFAAVAAVSSVATLFGDSFVDRVNQIQQIRSPLVFLNRHVKAGNYQPFMSYNRRVLSGVTAATLRAIQDLVPAGEPVGAWVTSSFQLDFARNPLFVAEPAGLSMRWTRWPDGLRYFLIEYRGWAVRSPQELAIQLRSKSQLDRAVGTYLEAFFGQLAEVERRSTVVYDDGAYLLLRVNER